MQEAGKEQIERGGGARWRLMRGDAEMACDVDSAGSRSGPCDGNDKAGCRLGGYPQLIAKAWEAGVLISQYIAIYRKRSHLLSQVYPNCSGVVW